MQDEQKPKKFQRENIKKGVYILPNLATSASLFAGFYGFISAYNHEFKTAAYAVIISAVMDMLDGRIARMTNSVSKFGVEFDSLADLVAFGAAPAFLVYVWALEPYGRLGWMASFLFMLCGALRLARFNVQVNTVESRKFNGLPIPGAAIVQASTVIFYYQLGGEHQTIREYVVLAQTFVLAFLMVSSIKYNSFKDLDIFKRKPFSTLILVLLMLILVITQHELFLFVLITGYAASGPVQYLYETAVKRRRT